MPDEKFVRFKHAIRYTGSNGPEVCAFGNMPLMSDNGSVLVVGAGGVETFRMNAGDWYDSTEGSYFSNTEYFAHNIRLAETLKDTDSSAAVAALQSAVVTIQANQNTQGGQANNHASQIGALQSAQNTQAGQITALTNALNAKQTGTSDIVSIAVPILLLGGSADRVVTWARPFPDANYKISYAFGVNTLGRITPAVVAGTKTATGVTIRLSAGLALAVADVIHVLGTT